MKSYGYFLITIFLLSILFTAYSQTYNGTIILRTQAQIDSFNYTKVDGAFGIEESIPGNISTTTNVK